jgi:hypothetical protein
MASLIQPHGIGVVADADLAETQLMRECQAAGVNQPDRPGAGAHRRHEQPQELGEKCVRRRGGLRKLLDLPGHLQDPVAGLLHAGDVGHASVVIRFGQKGGAGRTAEYLT